MSNLVEAQRYNPYIIPKQPGNKQPELTFVIVNPQNPGYQERIGKMILGTSAALPIVGSEIGKVCQKFGVRDAVDIKIIDENRPRQELKYGDREIYLVSAFTLAAGRGEEIVKECVKREIPVMTGGIHASISMNTEYPLVDFAKAGALNFIGEAGNSVVFDRLIEDILRGIQIPQGINLFSEGFYSKRLGIGNVKNRINLAGLPVDLDVYRQVDNDTMMRFVIDTMGCPYDCEFCAATFVAGSVIRTRPVSEVIGEIKARGLEKTGWFFADENILAKPAYARELFEGLAKEIHTPVGWTSETNLSRLDDGGRELIKLMRDAGCQKIWVGMESPDENILTNDYDKEHNLKYCNPNEVKKITDLAHEFGIKVCAFYMAGSMLETPESMQKIVSHAKQSGFDEVNLNYLTLFPGTRLTNRLIEDGRYDPTKDTTDHLSFKEPPNIDHPMGNNELIAGYESDCQQLYASDESFKRAREAYRRARELNWPEGLWHAFSSSYGSSFGFWDMHRGGHMLNTINEILDPLQAMEETFKRTFGHAITIFTKKEQSTKLAELRQQAVQEKKHQEPLYPKPILD